MTAIAAPAAFTTERDHKPSIVTLTRVELRKMRDTRAGFWLLLGVVALSVLVAVLQSTAGNDKDTKALADTFSNVLQATNIILPVLGILLVTAEWSQRTGLVTFTLVPSRFRVMSAKFFAAVALGFGFWVLDLVLALAAESGIGANATDRWSLPAGVIVQQLLFSLVSMLAGLAFGAAFLNTPAAITLSFVLPIGSGALFAWHALHSVKPWLDQSTGYEPVTQHTLSGTEWAHFLSVLAIWVLLPLVIGLWRVRKADVR